jgi:hypothetical protein
MTSEFRVIGGVCSSGKPNHNWTLTLSVTDTFFDSRFRDWDTFPCQAACSGELALFCLIIRTTTLRLDHVAVDQRQ